MYQVLCYMGLQYSIVPIRAASKKEAIAKALEIPGVVSATIWN